MRDAVDKLYSLSKEQPLRHWRVQEKGMEYLHEYYWPILLIPSSLFETTTLVFAFLRSQRSIQVNQWANKTMPYVGCAVDRLTAKCKWRLCSKEHQTKTQSQKSELKMIEGMCFLWKLKMNKKNKFVYDVSYHWHQQKSRIAKAFPLIRSGRMQCQEMCVGVCVSWKPNAG